MFGIFVITDNWFMHFICSTCLWHSVVFWIVFLVCCNEGFFSLRNRHCAWLLFNLYLIILADHHQIDIRNNNLFLLNLNFFLFSKWNVWNQSFYCSVNVLDSICQVLLFIFQLMFEDIFLKKIFVLTFYFLSVSFNVIFCYLFAVNFFSCDFHVDLICKIFYDKGLLIKTEIFGSSSHKSFFVTDNFSIKSINYWVGLFKKSVDSADLLQIFFPLWGMFNDDSKIDIFVFRFDSTGNLFTLIIKVELRKLYQYCRLNLQLCNYSLRFK